ncbi:MAG: MATE family efflux transporter [Thermoproteota archaeon]
MTEHPMRDKILNGNVIQTALILGWPVMLSNLFQSLYNLTDAFWLGKLGPEAVAAPSISWPIIFFFISLSGGFGVAGVSLVSQYTGAGSPQKANEAAGQLLSFLLITSCLVAVVGFLFAGNILILIGSSPEVIATTTPYLQIMFIAMPFIFGHFGFRSLLRGYGDTRTPMILTVASSLFDTLLDPFFVFGWGFFPRMGVSGAALTTLITRGVVVTIDMYLLFSGKVDIKLKPKYLKPNFDRIKKIVSIGLPSSIGQSGTSLGFVALIHLVTLEDAALWAKNVFPQGTLLAAYGIGSRIITMVNVVIWGGVTAMSTMIGQNLGAEQTDRAEEITGKLLISFFGLTAVGSAVLYFFRIPLYRFFINDPAVLEMGSNFITTFVPSIPFFAVFRLTMGVFQGSGHTKPSMILSLLRLWGLRVTLSYAFYFIFGMGAVGIWIGMALSNFAAAGLAVTWLSRGKWKEKVIQEEIPPLSPIS